MHRSLRTQWTLAAALAGCLWLCACQSTSRPSPYVKNGRTYGITRGTFNDRWWNYYERGLSFADGEYWKEAEQDLREALRQNDEDSRRAQTYGMHFVDYFPHRELGVVYFRMGRLDEAERQLTRSLAQEDTAKAHYFLGQVHGMQLKRGGLDRQAPRVSLENARGLHSATPAFTLRGRIEDDHAVAAYAVNDTSYYVRAPGPDILLEIPLNLTQARTPVRITAVDLVGNATIYDATVVLDQTGPFLVVEGKRRGGQGWEIMGRVTDNLGETVLTLDNRPVPVRGGKFSVIAPRSASRVLLEARDQAGNVTELPVSLTEDGSAAPQPHVRFASLPHGTLLAAAGDGEHASIRLVREAPARVTTAFVTLHLDLACESQITRVSIGGEPMVGLPRAQTLTFSQSVELSEGANRIEIVMETSKGTRQSRTVTVERSDAEKPLRAERLRLAFHELSPAEQSDTPAELCAEFNRDYELQLTERGRFSILARKQLEHILLERKLSIAGLADPRYATKLAGLAIADEVVTGSIRVRRDGIAAETRLVDVRTGEVDAAADVFHEKTDPRTLDMLARSLCSELENRFPVVRGKIVEIQDDGAAFVLDKGTADGLREGLPVVVFEARDFDTRIVGRGRLDSLKESRSRGRLDAPASLRVGLEVMTR